MSKKKMCPRYGKLVAGKWLHTKCPKNTNDKCEIIPKKPKMVRVKAWGMFSCITGRVIADELRGHTTDFPCTILIDEKYLRRKS